MKPAFAPPFCAGRRLRVPTLLVLVLCLLPAAAPANDSFLPAEEGVRERDILDEIRAELGESLRPTAQSVRPAPPPVVRLGQAEQREAVVRLADGSELRGRARMSAVALILETEGGRELVLPGNIQTLSFSEWRAVAFIVVGDVRRSYYFPTRCHVLTTAGVALGGKCLPYGFLSTRLAHKGTTALLHAYFRGDERDAPGGRKGGEGKDNAVDGTERKPPPSVVSALRFDLGSTRPRRTAAAAPAIPLPPTGTAAGGKDR